jgi:hypothetical protein
LIRELAAPLRITYSQTERENPDLQTQLVLAELRALAFARAPHHCLLILDNVDRPELLEPAQTAILPGRDWLHVLATTRLSDSELFSRQKDRAFISVDELAEEDALDLMESYKAEQAVRQ